MKKKVFVHAALLESLAAILPETAEKITAAGEALRANFPNIPWNARTLWILANEPDARRVLYVAIMERAAEAAKLPCDWQNEKPTEETRLNRKLVELQTREARAPFLALDGLAHLGAYLRTGVITISKKGETITAQDAAARLAEYCTLYAETDAQAAFVAGLEKMQAAALALESSYKEALAAVPAGPERDALARIGWQYNTPAALGLAENGDGFISLFSQDAAPRALISFFRLSGTAGAPKFYNLAGVESYTAQDAAQLVGCKPEAIKRLALRTLYPALFSGKVLDTRYDRGVTLYPAITTEG